MPATEKTWRDQKWMHVVFGVSSLIMLVSTVWMFAKDHNREWRQWQMKDRGKERWALDARLNETSAASHNQLRTLQTDILAARSAAVDEALVQQFKDLAIAEDRRLLDAGTPEGTTDLDDLDRALAKLNPLAAEAGSARAAVEPAHAAAQAALEAKLAAEASEEENAAELQKAARQEAKAKLHELQQAAAAQEDAEMAAAAARQDLLDAMDDVIQEARRREDAVTVAKKFEAANHTAATSEFGILINEGAPADEIAEKQAKIDQFAASIAELDSKVAAAKDYRTALEAIRRQVVAEETAMQKEIDGVRTELNRLADNRDKNTWNLGEWVTRWPILNALYDGNVRIDQIWLPDIKINYNFSSVPRYDRCTTCHRSIDKTAPGSAVDPLYPAIPDDERVRTVELATPESAPQPQVTLDDEHPEPTLLSVYGFTLADEGQIDSYDVTIEYVLPESLAAQAGLEAGDVFERVNGAQTFAKKHVEEYLLGSVAWGEPLELTIRRGLPQPYTSHPRLDLFVGSLSPHKRGDMGCTICHDGQGSATDFKWASHAPNNPDEAQRWSRKYGWFDNHHWIFPMTPDRFIESNCLKCHHEVVDLEPSERFPEPPAPKLVEGYHTIREFGCHGCHEINGYDGPERRIGPDLRLEPNYHEAAAAILNDLRLTPEEAGWAATLVHSPENDEVRSKLLRAINDDANQTDGEPRLSADTHKLADLLKDVDAPGKLRKVGPSLRHLGAKVDRDWLYSWIREPANFRPSTRMPQFFGLHEHLESHEAEFTYTDASGTEREVTDKEYTERFEEVEIRALTEFLLNSSSEFAYLDQPAEVTEQPSAERGQWAFQSRGCLGCHSHESFPGIAQNQGPDLSRMAAKFGTGKGRRWLYSWLKQPARYHAGTVMPNLYLDPSEEIDANGEPTGAVTDPAADIVEFLLGVETDWQPSDVPSPELTPEEEKALEDLAAVWLSAAYPKRRAARYATEGIPAAQGANIKGDERVLVGMTPANRVARQTEYVARRTISRYGCFGCHDIPGYEAAKPIGTALAEWGRKEPSKLAFENIGQFLATHGLDGEGDPHAHGDHGEGDGHHGLDPHEFDDDTGYFLQALNGHHRQGFLWQKLRMPRSYDYEKTRNKRYDERLRMPKFSFTDQQREAVMTFVLGLVNEPPAEKYIYNPGPREEAIVQGRHVLHKYNCGGCHVLDMEQWDFAFEPDWFEEPPVQPEFPFLDPNVTEEKIRESLATDRRGLLHASIRGMPVMSETTGEPQRVDEDGVPIEPDDNESDPYYGFNLYQDAVVAGYPRTVGTETLLIPAKRDGYGPARGKALPANGGALARYLFPHAIAEEQKANPQAKGSEAWGWLPPPLHDEGVKVQTEWLHGFLMDPQPLRPAVVMRMPNFYMTSDEARNLVNYFAAKSDAEWPYEYNSRRRDGYLASLESAHPTRFDDAMKIVTDGNYCVKCHSVGDFQPKGAIKTQGPQLAEAYQRLRADYVRNWVANPKRILPYTGMPVNIPYQDQGPHFGGVAQDLFPGTSVEQLDAVVDLLMNFDEYARRQTDIKSMVREAPPEGEQAATEPRNDQSAATAR